MYFRSLCAGLRTGNRTGIRACALAVPVLALATACSTVGGVSDHSRTVGRRASLPPNSTLAVVAPPANTHAPGLSLVLDRSVTEAMAMEFPGAKVLSQKQFMKALGRRRGYQAHFGQWLAGYARTDELHAKPLPHYAKATGVRYLLLMRAAEVRKERIAARDAACGFGCQVPDPNDLWRNRLTVVAEVIDMQTGKRVWQGVGESHSVTPRVADLDFDGTRYDLSNPALSPDAGQLVGLAASGIAAEVAGKRRTEE